MWNERARVAFLFKDSLRMGGYLQSAGEEGTIRTYWNPMELKAKMTAGSFAGVVCIETEETTAAREKSSAADETKSAHEEL